MKNKTLLKNTLLILSCILLTVLGFTVLNAYSTTTIGLDISTGNLALTGNVTSGTWQGTLIGTQYGGTGQDFNSSTGLLKITDGTASMITDNSTNWDTAYGWGNWADSDEGFVTASSTSTLTNKSGNISMWVNDSGYLTGNETITLSGDITGSGTTAITTTLGTEIDAIKLADGSVSNTEFQYLDSVSSSLQTQLDNKIAIPDSSAQGDVLFRNDSDWTRLAAGTTGQFLKTQGTGADPAWANIARTATFVVATSAAVGGSSTLSQQQADYVCDGTDDQVEIQAAIDALPDNGGKVVLMEGTYNSNGLFANITNNNTILEAVPGTIIKLDDGANTGIIHVVSAENVKLIGLNINGNRANQSVELHAIQISGNSKNVHVQGCRVWDEYGDGVELFGDVEDIWIVDNHFDNTFEDSVHVNGGKNIHIIGNTLLNDDADGVKISSGIYEIDKIFISNNYIAGTVTGITLGGSLGAYAPELCEISGNLITTCTVVGILVHTNAKEHVSIVGNVISECHDGMSIYKGATIIGNTIINNTGRGIYIIGDNIIVSSNTISYNNEDGIYIYGSGSDNLTISNNIIYDNSYTQTNTYNGLHLHLTGENDVDNWIISGNRFYGSKQRYCTYLKGNAGSEYTNIILQNNIFKDGATGLAAFDGKINTGTNNIIQNNIGYTTEASGTATILSATTSIAVTHGLAVTPVAGDITVTPMESLTNANSFWIDTYTSTQFTINTDVAPGADTDFAWKAIVL